VSHPPLSPHTDTMAAIIADNARQVEEAGGEGTLQGREARLSLSIQEWIGREVEMGTPMEEFISSALFAFALNVSNMAHNAARAKGADAEAVLANMEEYLHRQAIHTLHNRPETGGIVTPIIKQ
jgi:hypothetical protein